MATTVLGLKTFTASDPVDYNEVNDNYVKIENGVKTAFQGRAAQNILDNSYFKKKREIVNQRGKTSYSGGGYTIDRWSLYDPSGDGSLVINDGYISLTGGTGAVSLSCRFPKGIIDANKTYTKVFCDNQGNINPCSLFFYDSFDSFEFSAGAGETKNIVWAALYEGSYTADTLPAYVPKGYAAELAECQRQYFPVFKSETTYAYWTKADGDTCKIYIPSPKMRVNPTPVLYDGGCTVYLAGNGIWSNAVTLQYYGYAQGCNVFSFSSPSAYFETGKTYLYRGIKALSAEM